MVRDPFSPHISSSTMLSLLDVVFLYIVHLTKKVCFFFMPCAQGSETIALYCTCSYVGLVVSFLYGFCFMGSWIATPTFSGSFPPMACLPILSALCGCLFSFSSDAVGVWWFVPSQFDLLWIVFGCNSLSFLISYVMGYTWLWLFFFFLLIYFVSSYFKH